LSFGARTLFLDISETVQWKAAGDTDEHVLNVVDTFGSTLENFIKKICLPRKTPTTNTSQVM